MPKKQPKPTILDLCTHCGMERSNCFCFPCHVYEAAKQAAKETAYYPDHQEYHGIEDTKKEWCTKHQLNHGQKYKSCTRQDTKKKESK